MEWNIYNLSFGLFCHPWWLVAGSITVMAPYGHGIGDSKMVCLLYYIYIMFQQYNSNNNLQYTDNNAELK